MNLRCIHELSEGENGLKIQKGFTDFGVRVTKDSLNQYFNNDPSQSKMSLDLDCIFE